jgi:hypothetical protein
VLDADAWARTRRGAFSSDAAEVGLPVLLGAWVSAVRLAARSWPLTNPVPAIEFEGNTQLTTCTLRSAMRLSALVSAAESSPLPGADFLAGNSALSFVVTETQVSPRADRRRAGVTTSGERK